jgi:hypothetical protein
MATEFLVSGGWLELYSRTDSNAAVTSAADASSANTKTNNGPYGTS